MKLKKAITLVELLITLLVIGTVSMLTIPILKDYHTEQDQIAGTKKAFHILSNVTAMIVEEYGPVTSFNDKVLDPDTGEETGKTFQDLYNEYMSIEDKKTPDGAVYNFYPDNSVIVDVNGSRGTSEVGKDVVRFVISKEDDAKVTPDNVAKSYIYGKK